MKKYVIGFIIGAIIFTGITVLATNLISADSISYDENTTVKDKIDDLYDNIGNYMSTERFGTPQYAYSQGNVIASRTVSITLNKGKYLIMDAYAGGWAQQAAYTASHRSIADASLSCTDTNKCSITNLSGYWNGIQATDAVTGSSKIVASTKNYLYYVEVKENNVTLTSTYPSTTPLTTAPQAVTLTAIPLN